MKIRFTERQLLEAIQYSMSKNRFLFEQDEDSLDDFADEEEIEDIDDRLDDLEDEGGDVDKLRDEFEKYMKIVGDGSSTDGRLGYIRQLTADVMDYLVIMTQEINRKTPIPVSVDKLEKLLTRKERKRYYMSTLRL